jgi:hypothetical protein
VDSSVSESPPRGCPRLAEQGFKGSGCERRKDDDNGNGDEMVMVMVMIRQDGDKEECKHAVKTCSIPNYELSTEFGCRSAVKLHCRSAA